MDKRQKRERNKVIDVIAIGQLYVTVSVVCFVSDSVTDYGKFRVVKWQLTKNLSNVTSQLVGAQAARTDINSTSHSPLWLCSSDRSSKVWVVKIFILLYYRYIALYT